ncbi:MAG TPA: hypothetical protein VGY97_11485 [Solirubrobacteraceae bacterium]|nr:hypothetical protein [Solirubrobacteraceae bacterium]
MTTLLLDTPAAWPGSTARAPDVVARRGPTLDDLIAGAWEALQGGQEVACPTCGESMQSISAPGGLPRGGCPRCGSQLA